MNKDKVKTNVEWETFCDDSFFHMFAVRPVEDKSFGSPRLFHFLFKEDAEKFKSLIEKAHISTPKL
jgi:hypothetical protein